MNTSSLYLLSVLVLCVSCAGDTSIPRAQVSTETQAPSSVSTSSDVTPSREQSNSVSNTLHADTEGTLIDNFSKQARCTILGITEHLEQGNPEILHNLAPNTQLVRFDVQFTGVGKEAFPFAVTNFSLDTKDEELISESSLATELFSRGHMPRVADIALGKTLRGSLYFEVPSTTKVQEMVLSYESMTGQGKSKEFKMTLKQ